MKFLHTMVRVKDIEKSLAFYTDVLNMKLDHKKRLEDCWLYFLTDEENTCQIELTYNDETPEGGYELGSGFGHFAFSVDSLDEFTDKINKLGYSYLSLLLRIKEKEKNEKKVLRGRVGKA